MKLDRNEFRKRALEQMDMLYRIARRLSRDNASAEDLVQETYLRAFRGEGGFDFRQFGIRPWLLRILHNLHVNRVVREQKQPRAIEDERLDVADVQPPAAGPELNYDLMDEQLVRAMNGLTSEYQTVMVLWAVEGFSYQEIADALTIPIGTVMSRLYRARQKLMEQLRDYARQQGIIRE